MRPADPSASDVLPLEGAAAALRRRAAAMLAQRGIAWRGERRPSPIEPGRTYGPDVQIRRSHAAVAIGSFLHRLEPDNVRPERPVLNRSHINPEPCT